MRSLPFDLAKIPPDKLVLLLARYRAALDQEKQIFEKHKKEIIERFEEKYRVYKTSSTHPALLETELLFFKNIKSANSVSVLMQRLLDEIQRIRTIERKIGQDFLVKMIENECIDLCRKGKLLRDFKNHVIPDVTNILSHQKIFFGSKAGDLETAKIYEQVFIDFEKRVSACVSEKELKDALVFSLKNTYEELSKCIERDELMPASSPIKNMRERIWQGNLNPSFYYFKIAFQEIYNELRRNAYLRMPEPVPGIQIEEIEGILDNINLQMDLYKNACEDKINRMIKENRIKMNSILDRSSTSDINELFGEFFDKFIRIIEKERESTYDAFEELKNEFDGFWKEFILECVDKMICLIPESRAHWALFCGRIQNVRKDLIRSGHIKKYYKTDNRLEIIDICCSAIFNSYRYTLGSMGKTRKKQLDDLFDSLYKTEDEIEARAVIEDALFNIEGDHQINSLSYNMVLVRKKSRAVMALEEVLAICQRKKLIPHKDSEKTVSEEIVEGMGSYFDSDLVLNTRSRRVAIANLLGRIRYIEVQVKDKKLNETMAKQIMTKHIDDTLEMVNVLHAHGEGVARLSRLLNVVGDSRFVQHLTLVRNRLIKSGLLLEDYTQTTWLTINTTLTEALVKVLNKAKNEVEVDGFREAQELIKQLRNAGEPLCAAYILNQGIQALKTDKSYIIVANALEQGQCTLEKNGIIPIIANSEFSSDYLQGLKKEFDRIRGAIESTRKQAKELKERALNLGGSHVRTVAASC